jgi:hypothetical protein
MILMEPDEAQKKAMEEQLEMREKQAKIMLKQFSVNRKLVERAIDRVKADRDVVEKVELAEEKNEIKKKALRAKLAEMDAILEGEKLKLEMIEFNKEATEKQLAEISKMRGS